MSMDFKQVVLPALLAGTARQPLPSAVDTGTLAALSLTGQFLRFEVPSPPPSFATEVILDDRRRILPDHLRRPLLRLLLSRLATEHPALAVARAFEERGLRPHPFDMPKLDAFVRTHADRLGATAQQWAARDAEAVQASHYDLDSLDDTTWSQSPLSRRVQYLNARRSQDPAAARALVAAVWPQESAEVRFRLLQTLQQNLTTEDQSFLEGLNKDRAPRIRQLARRLLARLGTAGENPALAGVLERIKRSQTGIVRRRPTLSLELPATVKELAAPQWIHETFSEVSLHEFSQAFEMSEAEIVAASTKDANLLLAIVLMATIDRHLDVMAEAVTHLPQAWQLLHATGLSDLGAMSLEERLRWADMLIRPYERNLPWDYPAWSWLHRMIDAPAPPTLLDAAFRSGWFDEEPTIAKHNVPWMEVTAALCPPEQRARLYERLSAFDPALTLTALPLLNLLDALEKDTPHA